MQDSQEPASGSQAPSYSEAEKTKAPESLREAWRTSPGPQTRRQYVTLFLKGVGMGTADIIPGVSGGTIAFITGIYEQLLNAIASADLDFCKILLRGHLKEALAVLHLRFLLILVLGISVALVSTARLMHYLLTHQQVLTWSIFLGLISASVLVVGRSIQDWKLGLPGLLIGVLIAYGITGFIPVQTPESLGFIFFSGMIAICAMILPGLSGAFILLILGKYAFITSVLRDPLTLEHLQVLFVFIFGCLAGLLGFTRILRFGLQRFRETTLGLLTGFMIGAMRKVWPWKIPLESEIIRGREYVLREINVMPEWDIQLAAAAGLMLLGFLLVIFLENMVRKEQRR